MLRIKWFELFTAHSVSAMAERLRQNSYSDDSSAGFELTDVSRRRIVARFIQRESVTETSVNPYGETVTATYIKYTRFEFRIISKDSFFVLCLHSPPRSLRVFISALIHALSSDCAIGEIELDICTFLELVKRRLGARKLQVVQAIYIDVPLTKESTCKVQISSLQNAIEDFNSRLGSGKLERATCKISTANFIAQFDIGRRCTLRLEESDWEDVNIFDEIVFEILSLDRRA